MFEKMTQSALHNIAPIMQYIHDYMDMENGGFATMQYSEIDKFVCEIATLIEDLTIDVDNISMLGYVINSELQKHLPKHYAIQLIATQPESNAKMEHKINVDTTSGRLFLARKLNEYSTNGCTFEIELPTQEN